MFNYEQITKMTPDEIKMISEMIPIANAAKKAVEMIKEVYTFHIGEETKKIWGDAHNSEFITHKGEWQARYLHQSYDVKIDEKTVFDYFAAQHICQEGLLTGNMTDEQIKEIKGKELIAGYFTNFVRKTELEYHKNHPEEKLLF